MLRPPYQFDAATPGQRIAFSQFFGQHGYLPDLVDLDATTSTCTPRSSPPGPGIAQAGAGRRASAAIDVAPTLAFLLGIPGPQNARGKILYELLANGRASTEGGDDPRHQRLPRPADAAHGGGRQPHRRGAVNPTFAIGGAAFLKPWFDVYRAEAEDGSITVAGRRRGRRDAADLVLLRRHADDRAHEPDGLRRRRRSATTTSTRARSTCATTLIPLAQLPVLVGQRRRQRTARRRPSGRRRRRSTSTASGSAWSASPTRTSRRCSSRARSARSTSIDPIAARQRRGGAAARRSGVDAVVAIGHIGATAGTLDRPDRPAGRPGRRRHGVDAVIGDHTDFQVLARRPNGVLVTENRSKGVRFTRVRLVVDTSRRTSSTRRPTSTSRGPSASRPTRRSRPASTS